MKLRKIEEIENFDLIKKIVIDVFYGKPDEEHFYKKEEVQYNFLIDEEWWSIDSTSFTKDLVDYIYKSFEDIPEELENLDIDKHKSLTFSRKKDEVTITATQVSDNSASMSSSH